MEKIKINQLENKQFFFFFVKEYRKYIKCPL
jgi:hypothetical protein